jgi:predicted RNA binding protein YcfA (HicA-like mRNA interferase family)
VPKKNRELKAMLRRAGFLQVAGGKGSHTKWRHPNLSRTLTLSGNDGADARKYQEENVAEAIRDSQTGGAQ